MPYLAEMIGADSAGIANQGNPAWVRARIGHLTGSKLHRVIKYSGREWGRASDKVRTRLMMEIVAERMTDSAMNHYVSEAMQHGIDFEPDALAEYERVKNVHVQPSEFLLHPTLEWFGGTPDGLVGLDGGVDTKCPTSPVYVSWRASNRIPEEHLPQIMAYLLITGRKWWDFAAYDPRIKVGSKLYVLRYEPLPAEREFVAREIDLYLQHVELLFRQVTEA